MENENKNRLAALAFSLSGCVSCIRYKKILERFPNASTAFFSNKEDLRMTGLRDDSIDKLIAFRNKFNPGSILQLMEKENIKFICSFENDYPIHLKEIDDPPIVLYYKGIMSPWPQNILSVVGSRQHSLYGIRIIENIIPVLSRSGISIVSGLALGIDALAHKEALQNGGHTCAVLGSGIDNKSLYPPSHRLLAEEIIKKGGVIISEFPPGTAASRFSFPQRNRIISGLSKMVLVVEANIKSGARITARLALEQNREVGAIPGNIFSQYSAGTNQLISEGAKLIMNPGDILECFNLDDMRGNKSFLNDFKMCGDEQEKLILEIIKSLSKKGEIVTSDKIFELSQLDSPLINSKLSILEIAGTITKCGSGYIFS